MLRAGDEDWNSRTPQRTGALDLSSPLGSRRMYVHPFCGVHHNHFLLWCNRHIESSGAHCSGFFV
jgi:hypothetical protein